MHFQNYLYEERILLHGQNLAHRTFDRHYHSPSQKPENEKENSLALIRNHLANPQILFQFSQMPVLRNFWRNEWVNTEGFSHQTFGHIATWTRTLDLHRLSGEMKIKFYWSHRATSLYLLDRIVSFIGVYLLSSLLNMSPDNTWFAWIAAIWSNGKEYSGQLTTRPSGHHLQNAIQHAEQIQKENFWALQICCFHHFIFRNQRWAHAAITE